MDNSIRILLRREGDTAGFFLHRPLQISRHVMGDILDQERAEKIGTDTRADPEIYLYQ